MKFWLFAVLLAPGLVCADDNWPQWRGPNQNGVADARDLPETWSKTQNIVWKMPLPSWSGSSPIVWGDTVFVTSPSTPTNDDERKTGGPSLLLLAISKEDGRILWEREMDTGNKVISKQNFSSPTPVTDGQFVWAVTGTGAVVAVTMDGEVVWKRNLVEMYGKFGQQFGYASSPLLYDGKLIVQVLHGFFTDEPSYVMAFDAATGEFAWRVERPTEAVLESPDSYGTPTLLRYPDKAEIIVSGGDYVTAHDPATGAEVWRAAGINPKNIDRNRIIVSPVAVDGMVYACSRKAPFLAFRGGGAGIVTESHLAWKHMKDAPDVPTPVCDGKHVYLFDDRGVVTCLDAKTGAVVWGPERTARGIVSASPILADGKLYITNEAGVTSVVAAGKFKLLATNTLPSDGKTHSTLAVSGNRLYLRTPTDLYCIGKK
ncbi:MAG TPA: PQQ-binding-like beta-propeller repeat protein [Candidatus Bathyarchaeia archaeon]|nr:PQQ-binding-like beta-propeller repeat protein [Candidatus Bathyarchaeia archaeon]